MVGAVFRSDESEWNASEPRLSQGGEEAAEGPEEIYKGPAEGPAQDAEDGTEEHSVPVALILCISVLPAHGDGSPRNQNSSLSNHAV